MIQDLSSAQRENKNLATNYEEILDIFEVCAQNEDDNIHFTLLSQINGFKECQKNLLSKIKLKETRIDDL